MSKLSKRRRSEIYSAVSTRIMDLRIALAKLPELRSGDRVRNDLAKRIDDLVYKVQCEASDAAVRAAGGES